MLQPAHQGLKAFPSETLQHHGQLMQDIFSQARKHVHVVKANGDLLKSRIKAKNPCGIKSAEELAA